MTFHDHLDICIFDFHMIFSYDPRKGCVNMPLRNYTLFDIDLERIIILLLVATDYLE